jgi:hypothetical protein
VVAHQDVGVNAPPGAAASLTQDFEKQHPVGGGAKDRLPPVAPIQDMIDRAGKLNTQLSGHAPNHFSLPPGCQEARADPFCPMTTAGTIDEKMDALFGEKGDSSQLALDGRLVEEAIEEVDLAELLASAIRNFRPGASTVPEQGIEAAWPSLRHRLRMAELHFRTIHGTPPVRNASVPTGAAPQNRMQNLLAKFKAATGK